MESEDGEIKLPRKPLGAYMQFVKSNRAGVVAANEGIKNTDVLKRLGAMWKELDADGKQEYEDAAAADKERYAKEIHALKARGIDVDGIAARQKAVALASSSTGDGFSLPLQRVKRIAKSHPKASTITSEGTSALIQAIGLFVESVAADAAVEAQRAGRKNVRYNEARTAIKRSSLRHFITPADFPEPDSPKSRARSAKASSSKTPAAAAGTRASASFMSAFLAKTAPKAKAAASSSGTGSTATAEASGPIE